jgi:hypothetical protein
VVEGRNSIGCHEEQIMAHSVEIANLATAEKFCISKICFEERGHESLLEEQAESPIFEPAGRFVNRGTGRREAAGAAQERWKTGLR